MTISELIARLSEVQAIHGDIPVLVGATMVSEDCEEYCTSSEVIAVQVPIGRPGYVSILTDFIIPEEEDDD